MYLIILLQQLIASGTHIIAKSITQTIAPPTVLFFRGLTVSIVFGLWYAIRRKGLPKIDKKDWTVLALLGFINIPINQFLFLKSMEMTTAPHVALAYALTPLFVLIISILFHNEKSTFLKTAGIFIAIAGTVLVLSEKFSMSEGGLIGDILALLASLSWALYTIIGKECTNKYGPIYTTALTMFIGFAMYIPIYFFMPYQLDVHKFTNFNWFQIFYLGAMTSGVGYALWYYALSKTDASKVSIFNNLQPILTAVMGYFFLNSLISWQLAVGGAIIITGVVITQRG